MFIVFKLNKRVRSSSGQSQNCVRLGTSRDKKCLFQVASSKFLDDRRVLRKKIAGTRIFTEGNEDLYSRWLQ